MLPGGGIGRGESPAAAASREMQEEIAILPGALALFATYRTPSAAKDDILHLFTARTDAAPRTGREIAEARFFGLDALPPFTSAATLRRIAEWRGEVARSTGW